MKTPDTLTTVQAIDIMTSNLDSLDGDAIAHLFELVMGGSAVGIDGGLEWTPAEDEPEEEPLVSIGPKGYETNIYPKDV
jgi:hypothetical protein